MSASTMTKTAAPVAVDYDPFAQGAIARVVPTTEPQREVWLADRLDRDASLAFNESVTLRLHGALDEPALLGALQALVDRHDALRANLGPDGETLCVYEQRPLDVVRHDLSALAPDAREAALDARLRSAVETPFALEDGALFRAELLRSSPTEHLLLLSAHHIVCDGWSWWVLVRELSALYAAATHGGDAGLAPAEPFADYALRQATQPADAGGDEAYWLDRFADGVPVLDLPTDRPRPARRTFASVRRDFAIAPDALERIRRMGAQQGASLFATLLAGFASTLGRLCGQDRIVVGVPSAGQSVDGHDTLVGHCVNTLPLRFDLDAAQTAAALVAQAQSTLLDALDHQRCTYGTLLRKLAIERDPARLPLVSVLFNIDQALDQQSAGFPGLRMEFGSTPRSRENFELFVNAVQVDGGLRLECQYNSDLFDAATIARWLGAYRCLLEGMAAQPGAVAAALPLLDAPALAELQALQPSPTPYDAVPVHALFERQCDRTPERIAACDAAGEATYAELDARANRIAHLLRAQGVHPGALVGISVGRDIGMLAALLGVLKAGAGYVPLDPGFPADRLAYMAGDAGLAALLTTRAHADRFDLRGRPVLALDMLGDALGAQPSTRISDAAADPEAVAYVIYTSGSTGRPKGVRVPHRAVVNFLQGMRREPGLDVDDRLLAVTTLSFDIAVLELLLPLVTGARVVIAERDTAVDGAALAALLRSSGATAMQATPATWRMLLDADWRGGAGFKALCGGEPLPPDLAAALLPRCDALWNLYGPTETTVWSTCARVRSGDGRAPDIHIGRPIANTSVWIVDAGGQPCPLGVPGEVCIGGEGVTLGYQGRPDLTAERFVEDRFTPVAPGRVARPLYRTGDRGRWRADGQLQHLGRLDFQVKVRGYRIELGEIESMLAAHPDVGQALALAREDTPGDVRLVAYAVAKPGASLDEAALLAHLRGTLPEYMVPQHLMALPALPLLPNGKIDRKALPPPALAARAGAAYAAPRTPLERSIAEAMAQVLGLPEVGIHDDFFALGGHSLLAARLTTRLSRELDRALSLRLLFDGPTAARLASLLSAPGAEPATPRVQVRRRDDQRTAPLSLMQERCRLFEEYNPGNLSYNGPSAHRLTGPLDPQLLDRAFRDLAQRQTVLRTSIETRDGQPVQVVHDDIDPGLDRVEDLSMLPPAEREPELARRMREMIDTPFPGLRQAPLFVARLFRLAPDEHVLFFMPHHVIWDGWSYDLLYADLSEIYAALDAGRAPVLPDLPVTYGDYAAWHLDWMQGEEYAGQVRFWRERLGRPGSDGQPLQALPTDMPRRRGMSGRSASHPIAVDASLTDALRAASREMDVTLFVALFAAYVLVLGRMAGSRDIVVGTPVRGRNSAEVEGLMGYFTNLLPLRMAIDPSQSFHAFARDVRAAVIDSFAHPDIRLEDLSRELSLRSEGGGPMLYHALFSFQDIRHRVTRWGPLAHERVEVFQPGATEDLGLWFVEDAKGLVGGLIYNASILRDDTTLRLRDRYLAVLAAVARDPSANVRDLTRFDDAASEPAEAAAAQAGAGATNALDTVTSEPMDPRIEYLTQMWTQLLDTPVAPNDNFFDAGGNSMLAVQMAERVARDTGVRLKLMRIAVQTLADIASDLPTASIPAARAPSTGKVFGRLRRLFGS